MRPTASVGLTLEGAPAEAVLGYPGCLEGVNARHWSTVLFAAVFLGVGEGALREGVRQTATDAVWARATLADAALNLEAAAGFIEAWAGPRRYADQLRFVAAPASGPMAPARISPSAAVAARTVPVRSIPRPLLGRSHAMRRLPERSSSREGVGAAR